ncbi:MAG TPA: hypothetical protein VGQ57_02760, partial [Polyangiaceae bacterium]|nr:hypothetical protein [Polyangiaceae bacterium]
DRFLRNVLKRRWAEAGLDLDAAVLTLRRLPEVRRYRREHRAWNESRPGQDWFSDPRFAVANPLGS